MHNGLPYGKPLRNLSLKSEVSKIFQAHLSDVVARLAPCASTQGYESFNVLVSAKCQNVQNQGTTVAVAVYFTGSQQQFARKMKVKITYARFPED